MPLFEVHQGELVLFRRVYGGADLYEKEIENLLWSNLEEFTGDTLYPIARQPKLPTGGIPDIVALDKSGRVVVLEVKRDIDRRQLAQCLEYAGWARQTSLDGLAGMYHGGPTAFWEGWQEFTESATPVVVNPHPRLMLVAREFQDRTRSAFEFLKENHVPVALIRVTAYEDEQGRRFIDVEGDHEPEFPATGVGLEEFDYTKIGGSLIKIPDLIEGGLLRVGDNLVWERPRKGESYRAEITANGSIRLESGESFTSPSRAATEAAGIPAYDGWYAWKVERSGKTLDELRHDLHNRQEDE
ncbi:MAG: hypothetical protein ACE5F5_07205 [Acidimicrobiia bacterium]